MKFLWSSCMLQIFILQYFVFIHFPTWLFQFRITGGQSLSWQLRVQIGNKPWTGHHSITGPTHTHSNTFHTGINVYIPIRHLRVNLQISSYIIPTLTFWDKNILLYNYTFKVFIIGQEQWLTPAIPALWEAKAGGSRGQEFKTSLVNIVKPRLY